MTERLKDLVVNDHVVEAEALAKKMGLDAGKVLLEIVGHANPDVRLAVLEVAATISGPDVCRTALSLLGDAEEGISSLASQLLTKCSKSEVKDLEAAMEQNEGPSTRAALALRIGQVGSATNQAALETYREDATDPALHRALGLALARLGDESARAEVIRRLNAPDRDERIQALRDIEYIADVGLTANFADVLTDRRDAVPLSTPDFPPVIVARVCDIAVLTMMRLGANLSFNFDMLARLDEKHLAEAARYVKASGGK